jgi:hypothetical protein
MSQTGLESARINAESQPTFDVAYSIKRQEESRNGSLKKIKGADST